MCRSMNTGATMTNNRKFPREPPRRRRKKRAPSASPPLGLLILREPDVMAFTALPRSALWKGVRAGSFPKPVRLSPEGRAVGWLQEELLAWREQRIAARNTV
jgi:prophage regulatory protein